jgi:lipid-A-disaccharide synthase
VELSGNLHAKPLRIGIVAGEESGDQLGAGLMAELQLRFPDAIFEGIGGSRMLDLGFRSFFPQDRLAVMGFIEPLKRLPELLRIRKHLADHFTRLPPDVFIGIDSPDFNLHLEFILRCRGVRCVHYVSPSVWAWRQGRIKKIKQSVDLMLTLFPFENAIYEKYHVPVVCVGHPLAEHLPLDDAQEKLRAEKGIPLDAQILAILPGSRQAEVERLGPLFFATARRLLKSYPQLKFICPSANKKRHLQLQALLREFADLPVNLLAPGQSHDAMAVANLVLMASGTTSLEAMLLKKPMVIAYRVASLNYWIYRQLVKVSMIGLPNLLAGKVIAPEFIQDDATEDNLCRALKAFIDQPARAQAIQGEFLRIHKDLRRNGSVAAADAIQKLIEATPLCL